MSNLQEITTDIELWHYIAESLIKQNAKSVNLLEDEDGSHYLSDICMYRAVDENGNTSKCAVGWIINDIYYDESIEEKPVADNAVLEVVRKSLPNFKIEQQQVTMLQLAQKIHDQIEPDMWNYAFSVCREICFSRSSFNGPGVYESDYVERIYTLIKASHKIINGGYGDNLFPPYIIDEE